MKRTRISSTVALVVLPSILAGMALAAQDADIPWRCRAVSRFADFKGYEDWQVVSVRSQRREARDAVLGNPAMIEAYKAGIPGNGKPFPDGAMMAKIHWMGQEPKTSPTSRSMAGALHEVRTSW